MRGCPVSLASPSPGRGETSKKERRGGGEQDRGSGSENRRQQGWGMPPPPTARCFPHPFLPNIAVLVLNEPKKCPKPGLFLQPRLRAGSGWLVPSQQAPSRGVGAAASRFQPWSGQDLALPRPRVWLGWSAPGLVQLHQESRELGRPHEGCWLRDELQPRCFISGSD